MPYERFGQNHPILDAARVKSLQGLGSVGDGTGLTNLVAGADIDINGNVISRSGNKILLYDSAGAILREYAATQAGLTAALTAWTSGDTVLIPSLTIACTSGITTGATIRGMHEFTSILSFGGITGAALTLTDGATLTDLTVAQDGTGRSDITALYAVGCGMTTKITRCSISAFNAATNRAAIIGGNARYDGPEISQSYIITGAGAHNYALELRDYSFATFNYIGAGSVTGENIAVIGNGAQTGIDAPYIGHCWANSRTASSWGCQVLANKTLRAVETYFDGITGGVLIGSGARLEAGRVMWTSITNSGTLIYLPGDRAASTAPDTVLASPNPGNVVDECVVRGMVDGKVYWGSHRAVGAMTANGYDYAYNTLTKSNSVIATEAGKAAWKSVYNAADGLIYSCGQAYHDSITYRAAVWTTNPLTDAVTGTYLNDTGHATGDTNELIGILDDGTQLVCGERSGGGLTTGSDYPNGGGLWTIPKATIGTASTFARVYEETDATPHPGWVNLAKIGSTYFALLQYTATAGYKIKHATALTSWTTDIDGTALSLNDIVPSMCYHPTQNKVYAVVPNSSRQVVLYQSSGGAFTSTTFANLVLPSTGTIDLDIAVFGGDLILMVSNQPGGAIAVGTHDIYLISNLGTTPDFDVLYQNQTGATQHNNLYAIGADAYYPTAYLGGLNHLHLWSDNSASSGGTVTSIATGTGLTGGPITGSGTISDANTGVTAATYGDSTTVPQITVNAQGRITSAVNAALLMPINVYNETITADGINLTYYLTNYAAPGTIRVFINGIRQPASDDTVPTDSVTFVTLPALGDLLMFDYEMDQS